MLINNIILNYLLLGDKMNLLEQIQKQTLNYKMLNHPFYQDWMTGKLTLEQLQNYAIQYIPFVDCFPRMVSAIISLCIDSESRKLLLENLLDEEGLGHTAPHPQLWLQFAKGIGANLNILPSVKSYNFQNTYFNLCRSSFEEGLCALYSYESQISEIAKAKIHGLAQNYNITDKATIEFFIVHKKADVYHTQACLNLMKKIETDKIETSVAAATQASKLLWNFLSEVHAQ